MHSSNTANLIINIRSTPFIDVRVPKYQPLNTYKMPCVVDRLFPMPGLCGDESITMSGILEVVSHKGNPRVLVVVHRTTTEHFAVIYPIRLVACARKALSTINLKSSVAKKVDQNLIHIRPRKDIDGVSITLRVIDPTNRTCDDWIRELSDCSPNYGCIPIYPDLSCKPIRISSFSLPTLVEDVED